MLKRRNVCLEPDTTPLAEINMPPTQETIPTIVEVCYQSGVDSLEQLL